MATLRARVSAKSNKHPNRRRWFGPGDTVPAEYVGSITNPKAWADGEVPEGASAATGDDGGGGDPGDDEDADSGDPDATPYDGWTYADLQAECRDRGLPAQGNTDALIERLVEDDAEQADDDEDDDEGDEA